jgi:hypothetical protein
MMHHRGRPSMEMPAAPGSDRGNDQPESKGPYPRMGQVRRSVSRGSEDEEGGDDVRDAAMPQSSGGRRARRTEPAALEPKGKAGCQRHITTG